MAENLSAGVFIEEVPSANQTVDSVSTSNMGIVGFSTRGPTNRATLIGSDKQYLNTFGGLTKQSLMGHQVSAFFANGGKRAFVVRVVPDDAVKAEGFLGSAIRDQVSISDVGDGTVVTFDQTALTNEIKVNGGVSPVVPSTFAFKWRAAGVAVVAEVATAITEAVSDYAGVLAGVPAFEAGLPAVVKGSITFKWDDGVPRAVLVPETGIIADPLLTGVFDHATGKYAIHFVTPPAAAPGNLTVDYTPAAATTTLVDDGAGVFAAGTTLTGPGSINYSTGAFAFTCAAGKQPLLGSSLIANYTIKAWNLKARSEGLWGNGVQLQLRGNANYYSKATSAYTRFDATVLLQNEETLAYEAVESYEELVLDDPLSPVYLADVINELSDYLEIIEPASNELPGSLAGVGRTFVIKGSAGVAADKTVAVTLPAAPVAKRSVVISYQSAGETKLITDDGKGGLVGDIDTTQTATINYTTGAVVVTLALTPTFGTLVSAAYNTAATETTKLGTLAAGSDGSFTSDHFSRSQFSAPDLAATFKGLFALSKIDEIMQVVIPDFAGDVTVTNDLLDYAESRADLPSGGDRFIVLVTPKGKSAQDAVDWFRNDLGRYSKFAALYWPWVKVADPLSNNRPVVQPPLGHICGVYARTDSKRNVGKSPAGIVDGALRFITALEYEPTQTDRDYVYPNKINPLISSAQTGKAVWGARTISLESEWKYISARRLFMFVEKSIFNATHWVVFENNGPSLWSRVKTQLQGFLGNLFIDGYFAGTTPKDAYFVTADQSNNPQSSIDAGQVIIDVGIATNKPAEFARFRFQQKSLS